MSTRGRTFSRRVPTDITGHRRVHMGPDFIRALLAGTRTVMRARLRSGDQYVPAKDVCAELDYTWRRIAPIPRFQSVVTSPKTTILIFNDFQAAGLLDRYEDLGWNLSPEAEHFMSLAWIDPMICRVSHYHSRSFARNGTGGERILHLRYSATVKALKRIHLRAGEILVSRDADFMDSDALRSALDLAIDEGRHAHILPINSLAPRIIQDQSDNCPVTQTSQKETPLS